MRRGICTSGTAGSTGPNSQANVLFLSPSLGAADFSAVFIFPDTQVTWHFPTPHPETTFTANQLSNLQERRVSLRIPTPPLIGLICVTWLFSDGPCVDHTPWMRGWSHVTWKEHIGESLRENQMFLPSEGGIHAGQAKALSIWTRCPIAAHNPLSPFFSVEPAFSTCSVSHISYCVTLISITFLIIIACAWISCFLVSSSEQGPRLIHFCTSNV